MVRPRALATAALTACLAAAPALAADLPRKPAPVVPYAPPAPEFRIFGDFVSELKVGGLAHDIDFIAKGYEGGVAINGEVLFVSPTRSLVEPNRWFTPILTPRPMIGGQYAFARRSTDLVYGGLTWTFPVWGPVYFNFSFGLAGHNGNTTTDYNTEKFRLANPGLDPRPEFKKFVGCDPLFRESIELGFGFGQGNAHSLSAYATHLSHAQFICSDSRNSGMDHAGVRYGYRFDTR